MKGSNEFKKKIWQKAAKSLAEFYRNSQPRTIRPLGYTRPHAVIATDARGNLGDVWGTEHLGGVCFWTHHAAWFSDPIREGLIKTFADPDAIAQRQHRINKAEAIAALLALIYWRHPLAGHQVILLIDNMAAEGTLHRGYSPDADLCRITNRVWQICNAFDISLWIDRVPSDDNIADPGVISRSWRPSGSRVPIRLRVIPWTSSISWHARFPRAYRPLSINACHTRLWAAILDQTVGIMMHTLISSACIDYSQSSIALLTSIYRDCESAD